MGKRKHIDDNYSSGNASSSSSVWEPSSKTQPRRPKRTKQKAKTARYDSDEDIDERNAALRVRENNHPSSSHIIVSPAPICAALLDWYAGVHETRGMPWRKPYDRSLDAEGRAQRAYEVWISEIMLQQTQVVTVIPYYNKWMAKFPTIRDLAAADIETVNSLWKGLGYYSRAARLLKGAKKAVKELGGRLPGNATEMEAKIPGIGRYSAGAICSIAYNQRVPVLDGNVHRVLSRILALHAPPKAKMTLDMLWSSATILVENTDRPGDLNQALIELGSTVCKVREPACGSCPLQSWCEAYRRSGLKAAQLASSAPPDLADIEEMCAVCEPIPDGATVTSYPMKADRKKAREELDIVNVIEWHDVPTGDRQFLLVRRPDSGLLAGLHEFPTMPNISPAITSSDVTEITQSLLSWLLVSPPLADSSSANLKKQKATFSKTADVDEVKSLRITKTASAGQVIHVFSHIKKTYRSQWVVLEGGLQGPPTLKQSPDDDPARVNPGGITKAKKKEGSTVSRADTSNYPVSMWVPLDQVAEANVGNGVLKVWKQVKTLWEAG